MKNARTSSKAGLPAVEPLCVAACAAACMAMAGTPAHAAQVTATYTGASGGQYGTASNWDVAQVPLNNASNTYSVVIGPGRVVNYTVTTARAVDQLLMDLGSALNLSSSSLLLPTDLTVLGTALIAGAVNANHASFIAQGGGTQLLGDVITASAVNGAVVRIAAPSFSARGLAGRNVMNVAGVGSLLDLSSVQTFNSAFNSGSFGTTNSATASEQGVLRLSGIRNVVAPANSAYNLAFSASSGATVDLSSLQQVSGLTLDSGNTHFGADSGNLALGPLVLANRVSVSLRNGSTMTVGGAAATAAITNSTFSVDSASTLSGSSLVATYAARGLSGVNLLNASGTSTVLDLSGLQTVDSAFNTGSFGTANSITASDNALLSLAGVKTVVAPSNSAYNLVFSAISGARVDLSSLQRISGLTLDTGNTSFNSDAGVFALGPLQAANRMTVDLQNGASLSLGGYSGNASVTNSTFSVASGARVDGSTLVGDYSVRGISGVTFLRAAGAGSVLDLSGLQSINAAFNSGSFGTTNSVTASDLALINLGGVNTIVAPANAAYVLAFNAGTGARIELGSLQTVNTASGGQVTFNVASGGGISLRGFAAGNNVRFNAVDAGSNFAVTGDLSLLAGSALTARAGTRVAISGNYSFRQTVESEMNLDAATLVFNGSGLQTLEVGSARIVTLTNGAAVNGNFGIGELDVGQAGAATTLQLQDLINNNNRSGGLGEALYLNASAGGNGLRIFGGSVLALNNLDLWTTEGGIWVHINDRFTGGLTQIAYDQGYIQLGAAAVVPEPQTWAMFGLGLAAFALRRLRDAAREA